MENSDNKQIDAALEKLLRRATDPAIPEGAEARLMAAIQAVEPQSNVVTFRPRSKYQRWAIGIPLAASLALGIYLGSKDTFDTYLPDSITGGTVADTSDSSPPSGLDDVESYAEGELT